MKEQHTMQPQQCFLCSACHTMLICSRLDSVFLFSTDVTEEKLQQLHTSTQVTLSRCAERVQTEVHPDDKDSDNTIVLTDEWEIISPDECLNCPSSRYIRICTGMSHRRLTSDLLSPCQTIKGNKTMNMQSGEALWYVSHC